MTIASCYMSPEGVVIGADSTTTFGGVDKQYYNHAQKLFEIGQNSTLGMVIWGLGGVGDVSYRKLIADLADEVDAGGLTDVQQVASRWSILVWEAFQRSHFWGSFQECLELGKKPPHGSGAPGGPDERTDDEERKFAELRQQLFAGFCIAGYVLPNRQPAAWVVTVDPTQGRPSMSPIGFGGSFWGAPNMIVRLLFGIDQDIRGDILNSEKWSGTPSDLDDIISRRRLNRPPTVPMRDAIDFVHSCIYCTIKAIKFSAHPQICGGPIEMAVITADRPFRWVQHKEWDAAVLETGGTNGSR